VGAEGCEMSGYSVKEWIHELTKMADGKYVELDCKDCKDLADILKIQVTLTRKLKAELRHMREAVK